MNNNRINIIKHVEAQENKSIFRDFDDIEFRIHKYNKVESEIYLAYAFNKKYGHGFADVFLETMHNKFVRNTKEIANRIQYIKQSGYKFKEYFTNENSLTIVFE